MKRKLISWLLSLTTLVSACAFVSLTASAETYLPVAKVDWNGHTYHLYVERMTWIEAKQYCEEIGGHLVTITSPDEQKIVEGLLVGQPDADFYIGLHRDTNEFETWITGELVTYKNWGAGEPDNAFGGQSTGIIANGIRRGNNYHIESGEWDDTSNGGGGFICEWEGKKTSFGSQVSEWAEEEVEEAYNEGLVPEVLIGEDLTQKVDRAEFTAIAVALYENLSGNRATKGSNPFVDILGNACEDDILKAYNLEITIGTSDTTFEPDINITREQVATMLTRAYKKSEFKGWCIDEDVNYPLNFMGVRKFDDDNEISDYAKESVYFMVRWDIIQGIGDNKFAPKNSTSLGEAYGYATREQAVIIALRSAKYL